jgi:hypothetical protein
MIYEESSDGFPNLHHNAQTYYKPNLINTRPRLIQMKSPILLISTIINYKPPFEPINGIILIAIAFKKVFFLNPKPGHHSCWEIPTNDLHFTYLIIFTYYYYRLQGFVLCARADSIMKAVLIIA